MSGTDLLRAVAVGADTMLLNSVRLESGGAETFGVEAVSAWFRRHRPDMSQAQGCDGPGHAVLATESEALLADLHGTHIARLWHLASRRLADSEFAIGVAFDPDLRQERGSVYFDPAEHPALAAKGASRATAAAGEMLADPDGAYLRSRAFVVRAFGDGQRGAALCSLARVTNNSVRETSFAYAAAVWNAAATRLIFDQAWPAPAVRFTT
jgi:hypothetical protein